MVFADVARAHKALDIPVSAVYACFDGFYAECVHPSFVRFGVAQVGAGHGPTKRHQSVEGGYEVTAWRSVGGNRAGQEFASEEDCFESGEYIHEHFF